MPELFNYFDHVELPTPTLSTDEVEKLCELVFGIDVVANPLGSQQDQNFRLFPRGSDAPFGVLKLSNPVFSETEIRMQDAATDAVAVADPTLRVPRVLSGPRGALWAWWDSSQGRIHARVLENIAGHTLTGSRYLPPAVIERLGDLAGRVSAALESFEHPASGRILQWDLRHARRVIDALLPDEPDAEVRAAIERAVCGAVAALDPIVPHLPMQAGHFDITDDNVLRGYGELLPDAVIDFGDVMRSWRVAEIAVTASSVLHHDGADPTSVIPAIRAFHARRHLTDEEITALWPLVVLRGATLVLSGRAQVRLDDANEYAADALDRERRIFDVATSVPASVMSIRHDCRDPQRAGTRPRRADPDVGGCAPLHSPGRGCRARCRHGLTPQRSGRVARSGGARPGGAEHPGCRCRCGRRASVASGAERSAAANPC